MISGISSYAGFSSVFQAPSNIRPVAPNGQALPVQPVDPVERRAEQPEEKAAEPENTAPTEEQREKAVASGRTRGSFVDIRV